MAIIKHYKRNGIDFLGANNLIISDPSINEPELTVRYAKIDKNTGDIIKDNVVEDTYVPNDPADNKHKKAIYAAWLALKKMMKKAKEKEDLNPYEILNSRNFRYKLRKKGDAQQLSLKLDKVANSLENIGFIKEAYLLDVISNTIDACWGCNKVNLFKDELDNLGIEPSTANKILDLAEGFDLIKTINSTEV